MLKVGITGGIGSGKTTICEIFTQLGIPVFHSDAEANKLLNTAEVIDFYKKEFGEIVFSNGLLDKQKVANLIFKNPEALQKVNGFIHPLVNKNFKDWTLSQKNCNYVIKESALLLEGNNRGDLSYIVLVLAPLELRIKRVMLRDQTDENAILERIKNQTSDDEKMKLADFIISNDVQSLVLPQILTLHKMFLKEVQK